MTKFSISGELSQENEPDIPLLPPPEVYPTILLIHAVLHYPPTDVVHARSSATILGYFLHTWIGLFAEHCSMYGVIPIHGSLSSV